MLEKLIDASLPKILTERVLLAVLFLFLATEDYLLFTHKGNLSWIDKVISVISIKDVMYFVMVLALSWLCVLPFINTVATLLLAKFARSLTDDDYRYLTTRGLLNKAMNENSEVAYQHLENHIKHVKARKIINELYFYTLIAFILNLFCEESFTRHLFKTHLFIMLCVSAMVIFLGVAVGIIDNISNNDGITDVLKKTKEKGEE